MTDELTYEPPVRRVIRGLLSDYRSISDDLLVAMTFHETDAPPPLIRETIANMASDDELENIGDPTRPRWTVVRP
jgi:hypothetical protein